jgi:hypothetical protein
MYEHIQTIDQFRELAEPDQIAAAAERKAQAQQRIENIFDEVAQRHEVEQLLVPKLPIRRAAPSAEVVNLHPPVPEDIDSQVRDFFRRNPETREIRVGNTVYERSRR